MLDSESPVFSFDFFYLLDPTIGHHIEDMMQKVNDKQFLRFLDLYYVLICLKDLSHGLALPKPTTSSEEAIKNRIFNTFIYLRIFNTFMKVIYVY